MGAPHEAERFSKAWAGFYHMRNDIGKPLQSEREKQQIYKRLIDFSGGDYGIMADMLEKSTAKRWPTVFPLYNASLPEPSPFDMVKGMVNRISETLSL